MQNKSVEINQLIPVIREAVQSGSEITMTPRGLSMLPFLGEKDTVTLKSPPERLNKYDVALYFRSSVNAYVLHRAVGFRDGSYVFCGDNQGYKEFGVKKEDIVAVLSSAKRGGQEFAGGLGYRVYCRTLFIRRFLIRTKLRLKRMVKL